MVVKCAQTSKLHSVKIKDLSRGDCEPLTKKDLTKGSNLIIEMKGKLYPVKFMHFRDNKDRPAGGKGKVPKSSKENDGKKSASMQRKRQLEMEEEEEDVGQLRDKTNVPA